MKNKTTNTLFICATAFALSHAFTDAAVLQVGTKIGIDYGSVATNTAGNDWNEITTLSGSISAGSVISLNGVVVDGVAIATTGDAFIGDIPYIGWDGLFAEGGSAPVEFVDSVVRDITGRGSAGAVTISLTGLDALLRYNIYAVTVAGGTGTRQDTLSISGDTNYGPSTILRSNSELGAFHTFLNVGSNGSGNLTISLTDASGNNNPIINGILIEAIPEPSSALLGGLGLLALLRRRR